MGSGLSKKPNPTKTSNPQSNKPELKTNNTNSKKAANGTPEVGKFNDGKSGKETELNQSKQPEVNYTRPEVQNEKMSTGENKNMSGPSSGKETELNTSKKPEVKNLIPEVRKENMSTGESENMSEPSSNNQTKWQRANIHEMMEKMKIQDGEQNWWEVVDQLITKAPPVIRPETQRKTWKTVRLFISSTFKDMNSEREYLIKTLVPQLRQWCEERKIRLIECDLRWGVPKDADTRETLMACLSEIDRCREENEFPYFLCMLSERYGYVCDPDEVPDDIKVRYNWLPGMSVTALEIFTGAYWDRNQHALYMLRDPGFMSKVKNSKLLQGYKETKTESIESLEILKGKLRQYYRDQIREYSCDIKEEGDGELVLTGFDSFGEEIMRHFKTAIDHQYPVTSLGEEMTEVEIQKSQQMDFLIQRSHFLVGRDEALSTMENYIHQDKTNPGLLLLVGYPGAGKSSLMAVSAKQAIANNNYKIFYHFVGATPDSTDPYSILSRFYKECMGDDDNMPADLDSMLRYAPTMFQQSCRVAKKEGYERLVVYFDALNQMEEDGETSRLAWLPRVLSPELRIIVSTLEGPCLDALRSHDRRPQEVGVAPLTVGIRKDIVEKLLEEYNKQLDDEQMNLLTKKHDAGRPLWLSIACEELRVNAVFRGLTEKIQNLPGDLAGLTEIVLDRVIKDYGENLVQATLCLLECSRFGLKESELLELLAMTPVTYGGQSKQSRDDGGRILMADWAYVYLGLKPFLRPFGSSGEGRLDFYHRSTSKVVRQVYLADPEVKKWYQNRLVDYFKKSTDYTRMSEELPYQHFQLEDKNGLKHCLVHPDMFLEMYNEKNKQQLMKYWRYADGYSVAADHYQEHLSKLAKSNERSESYMIELKSKICWLMVDMGEYDKAERLLKPFIEFIEEKIGRVAKQLCEPYYALVTLYYKAALQFVYGSNEGYQKYIRLGRGNSARCIEVLEKNSDPYDNRLGEVYTLTGYFNTEYLSKAGEIFTRNNNKAGLAQVYYMLGKKNHYHDDINVPIDLFDKSVDLCLSCFGKIHLHTARAYQLYGQMYWNRWTRSRDGDLLQQCLGKYVNEVEILEEILGPHHPNVVRSRQDVIIILGKLGRNQEADVYRKQQPEVNISV